MILTPFLSVVAEAGISWVKARSAERQSLSKARSQRVLMATKTEASWAEYMAHASASGWKDEAWTLCFIAIIAACFIPATHPYVQQGFEMLDNPGFNGPSWRLSGPALVCVALTGSSAGTHLKWRPAKRLLKMTNQLDSTALRAMLIRHEGYRTHPYLDTVGKITIGVGRNLSDRGLSAAEIEMLLNTDIAIAMEDLSLYLPNWRALPAEMQLALISLSFNL